MSWRRCYSLWDRVAYGIAGCLPPRVRLMAYKRQVREKPLWSWKIWNGPGKPPPWAPSTKKGVSDVQAVLKPGCG